MNYAWLRIYSLNIDDALENTPNRDRAQRVRSVNRNDPVEEQRLYDDLEIVHLNGFIRNLDCGFVFTPAEYRSEIRRSSTWYQKCAVDFIDKVFVFIGTKLDEPVFDAHVEELARNRSRLAARSFLITPDKIGNIRLGKLTEKRIQPIKGTFASFGAFLGQRIGAQLAPQDIASNISGQKKSQSVSAALLSSIERIGSQEWLAKQRITDQNVRLVARDFFNGLAPSWSIVSNNIGVRLDQDDTVLNQVKKFLDTTSWLFVISGQSGSGKTTTLMKTALKLALEENVEVVSLNERSKEKLRDIAGILGDPGATRPTVLIINNLVLFADELAQLGEQAKRRQIKVIAQCRTSDWEGRVSRRAPADVELVSLPKLSDRDYSRLRDGIVEHAVAPRFLAIADKTKQIAFLKQARQQLLVLMKEATQQRNFEKIIEDEFDSIPTDSAKAAFCIVGLATIAKNEITIGELQRVLEFVDPKFDVVTALSGLGGIVQTGTRGLVGRHEIYVRHIFDLKVSAQDMRDAIVGFLRYFVQFGQPVILKLGKQQGNLFKFLLNSDWIYDVFSKKNKIEMAEEIYGLVEQEYQRDGHYWLQRGLFCRRRRFHAKARQFFENSIGAYPENAFAQHALAQQKLIGAAMSRSSSPILLRDVREAVDELERQEVQRGATDEYPLVTLARFHPNVLYNWGEIPAAMVVARGYFERLEALRKALPRIDASVDSAREICLKLATTGSWLPPRS